MTENQTDLHPTKEKQPAMDLSRDKNAEKMN